jgi:2-polyprenyl-3-methyl-5-hydroxy-6-metoxy-1,4-benzoquinol methylase
VTIGGFLRAAVFHYGRIVLNGNRGLREVAAALAARPNERVLDLGCGCGGFSVAVSGEYVGIDLDQESIAFARWRWGDARRRFEVVRLEEMPEEERFDAAILVSALHHLSDAFADTLLARLARMVRSRMVVLDLDPEAANAWQRFLLNRDRGRFIRPVAAQRALLERHFAVSAERRFVTATGSAAHVVFVCRPRRSAGAPPEDRADQRRVG